MRLKRLRCLAALIFTVVVGVIGCGGVPLPSDRLAATKAAIGRAEEVGAPRVPKAALHLQLAKEQTDHAERLIKDGENKRATWLLLRAEADAELSLALARETPLQEQAKAAMERVRSMQQGN